MKARDFAIKAHGSQLYGSEPYSVHLDAVAEIAGPGLETVAYLHDVLEDTPVSFSEIGNWFGAHVAECVAAMTDPPGENRRERKRLLHQRLARLGPEMRDALIVKAADRLANVRASARDNPSLLRMYRREHPEFRAAARRPGLRDDIWEELDRLLK